MTGADIRPLLEIMQRLRDPGNGCPWDLKQTFRTILPYTLEEAYEVADAIEREDMAGLREELGDLLFQVVFHARMAEEQAAFDFADVVESICDKMIRRHPHVFGDIRHANDEALRAAWEQQKHRERADGRKGGHAGVLDGVAMALPALVRAEKLQKRAARVGFDWDDHRGVVEKVREELEECSRALADGDCAGLEGEIGDLLFSCVNLSRHLGVDAEHALRGANDKFGRRFRFIEAGLAEQGLAPGPDQRERMEQLWESAKRGEHNG